MNAQLMWQYIGATLYPTCKNWKALLARDLDVKPNTVIQWAKGHTILTNEDIVRDIIGVLDERKRNIDYLIGALENMLDNDNAA